MASTFLFMVAELGIMFLGFGGLLFVSALIHEIGHVFGGLLCGFGIEGIRVGPLELRRPKGWALSRDGLAGGIVIGQFRRLPGPLAALQCFGFLFAGSLANLLVALILARLSASPTVAGAFSGWLAVVSLLVGVLNLIPFKTRIGHSDGAKLYWLMFSPGKRAQIIFGLSLRARVAEIIAFSRNQDFRQAIDKVDELISHFMELPNARPEATQPLSKMRERLEKALAESGVSNPKAQSVEG